MSSRFLHRVGALAVGNVVALGVSLIAVPVLSRLYSPADFGIYGMAIAVVAIITPVMTLRLDSALVVAATHETASSLFIIGTRAVLLTAIFVAIAVISVPVSWVPEGLAVVAESPLLALTFVGILAAQGYSLMSTNWLLRQGHIRAISANRTLEACADKMSAAALGVAGFTGWGLAGGRLIGSLALALSTRFLVGQDPPSSPTAARRRDDLASFRQHLRYAPAVVLIGELSQWIPVIFSGTIFGGAIAGYFLMSRQLIAMPLNSVGLAVQRVLMRDVAGGGSPQMARVQCERLLVLILPTVSLLSGGLFLVGENILEPVLGHGWEGFGRIAAILAIGYATSFLHVCFSGLFDAFSAHQTRLWLDVALLLLRLGAFAGALYMDWTATTAFWLFSGSTTAIYGAGVYRLLANRVVPPARLGRIFAGYGAGPAIITVGVLAMSQLTESLIMLLTLAFVLALMLGALSLHGLRAIGSMGVVR